MPDTRAYAAALERLTEADTVLAEAVHARDMNRLDRVTHADQAASAYALLAVADAIADLTEAVRSAIPPPGAPRRPF